MLRQVIVDVPPRRLRRREHVQPRAHARIIIKQSRWDAHGSKKRRLPRNQRAADSAECTETTRRRFITVDQLLARNPAELGCLHMRIRGEARSGELAARSAVTVC